MTAAETDAMRLVPVEPTEAMLNACPASFSPSFAAIWPKVCGDIYRAMLAAAPAPAAGREEIARAIADGFSNGYERYDDANEATRLRFDMAADSVLALAHPPAQGSESGGEAATWHPIDDNGTAEVRVNGKRITSMPSYGGAEEVVLRINAALSQPGPASEGDGEP